MSSLSLVRYRLNDYSVPVAYGHREVFIRCYESGSTLVTSPLTHTSYMRERACQGGDKHPETEQIGITKKKKSILTGGSLLLRHVA